VRPSRNARVIGTIGSRRFARPARSAAAVPIACVVACVVAMLALPSIGASWLASPVFAAVGQPSHAPAAASQEHTAGTGAPAAHEGASPWTIVARLFNFAVVAGTLVYFLRSPFMAFMVKRGEEIRAALVQAAELERKSAGQLAELDRRLAALPGEIDALRARGMADVAAEEARIRTAAEADRERLVEQARRQIDFQLRVARRELVAHAADLAVSVASERIRNTIRDDDQQRLVEVYLSRLSRTPASGAVGLGGGQP